MGKSTQFPLPYTQMSMIMLMAHWIVTPFLVCQWVEWPSWVFFLTLLQVLIFWSLYFTAVEIENPFNGGTHFNDSMHFHAHDVQKDFNEQLLMLIDPSLKKIPVLSETAETDVFSLRNQHNGLDMAEALSTPSNKGRLKRLDTLSHCQQHF